MAKKVAKMAKNGKNVQYDYGIKFYSQIYIRKWSQR